MNIVFVARRFQWPPRVGPSVHAGNLMKSLVKRGEHVKLITMEPVANAAQDWLTGVECTSTASRSAKADVSESHQTPTWLDRKVQGYFGTDEDCVRSIQSAIIEVDADAAVGIGFDSIEFLVSRNSQVPACWYLADDPALHHFELNRLRRLRSLATTMVITRLYARKVRATWVVSHRDANWAARVSGLRRVSVIPNGVDSEQFRAHRDAAPKTDSCCFWGNLSFPPNILALRYFLTHIWPKVKVAIPDAQFHVAGANVPEELLVPLTGTPGVVFHGEVADLGESLAQIPIAVFPFVEGAGVKNKVLEAAAMSKAVIVSGKASNGLFGPWQDSLIKACSTNDWIQKLVALLRSPNEQVRLGDSARTWVTKWHAWDHSAHLAIESLKGLI